MLSCYYYYYLSIILGWDNLVPSSKENCFEESYRSIADPATVLLKTIPACSCEVKDNVNVTIAAGHTLKVVE
jgi:hypothetical protein